VHPDDPVAPRPPAADSALSAQADLERRLAAERDFHNQKFGAAHAHHGWNAIYELPKIGYEFYRSEIAPRCPGAKVLEYGCGDDAYIGKMIGWGAHVTAIDISDEAVAHARTRAQETGQIAKADFARMNAEALTFPDNSFDLIVGRAILHHLDLDQAYRSIARCLKPNGTAIFLEPLGHNPIINLYRQRTPHLRTQDEHPLLMTDLDHARRYFGTLRTRYFTLSAMGALVFAKLPALFHPARHMLDQLDKGLFALLPPARRWAWTVGMVLEAPKKA
jgi:SAM-dependent methyltransferase